MNKTKPIIIGTLVFLFIIILLQNPQIVTLNILFWEVNTSTFYIPLLIVISICIGYLAAKLMGKKKNKNDSDYI